MRIRPDETSITEEWEFINNKMVENGQGKRIDWLRSNYLTKIANDESGWYMLYQDPEDKRYWELSFPKGEMQGGGPRLLKSLTKVEAASKYTF